MTNGEMPAVYYLGHGTSLVTAW